MMTLYVADEHGTLHKVDVEDIEEYNLEKPLARADVCEQIAATVARIKEAR